MIPPYLGNATARGDMDENIKQEWNRCYFTNHGISLKLIVEEEAKTLSDMK